MNKRILGLILGSALLTGCTVSGGGANGDRFERTGFPGIFEPSVTVIVDTKTGEVFVSANGAMVEGAIASALRRPSRNTNVMSGGNASAVADADASSDTFVPPGLIDNPGQGH